MLHELPCLSLYSLSLSMTTFFFKKKHKLKIKNRSYTVLRLVCQEPLETKFLKDLKYVVIYGFPCKSHDYVRYYYLSFKGYKCNKKCKSHGYVRYCSLSFNGYKCNKKIPPYYRI
jgi:hypothetical protein